MSFNSNKILVLVPLLALLAIPTIAWTRYPLYDNQLYDYTRPEVLYPNKGPYSTNLGDPEDFRSHVFEICRYNFAGAWNLITPDQMRFFELKRSIKDRWYYCGLPFNVRPLYREYGEAAVIFYGPGRRHPEDTTAAATVSAYFSQKQAQQFSTLLTPRILGTFPGGRIEEYWQDSHVARKRDVPFIAEDVVHKLAYIHGLNPPVPRSIDHFWHRIATLLAFIRSAQMNDKGDRHLPQQKIMLSELSQINLEAEALWLRRYLDQLRAPIVFSHGSPRIEQIYLRKFGRPENKLTFLDLGWGGYMYRSFDLADFLLEPTISYDERLPYPHFRIEPQFIPSTVTTNRLISLYLQSMTPSEREWPTAVNTVPAMNEEIQRSTLLSHFLYAVEALFSSYYDFGKKFGFPDYSKARFDMYFRLKKSIIDRKGIDNPLLPTNESPQELIDRGYPGDRLLNLNLIRLNNPFLQPRPSVTGFVFPQPYVTNNFDAEICQKLLTNNLDNNGLNRVRSLSSLSNYYSSTFNRVNSSTISSIDHSQTNQVQSSQTNSVNAPYNTDGKSIENAPGNHHDNIASQAQSQTSAEKRQASSSSGHTQNGQSHLGILTGLSGISPINKLFSADKVFGEGDEERNRRMTSSLLNDNQRSSASIHGNQNFGQNDHNSNRGFVNQMTTNLVSAANQGLTLGSNALSAANNAVQQMGQSSESLNLDPNAVNHNYILPVPSHRQSIPFSPLNRLNSNQFLDPAIQREISNNYNRVTNKGMNALQSQAKSIRDLFDGSVRRTDQSMADISNDLANTPSGRVFSDNRFINNGYGLESRRSDPLSGAHSLSKQLSNHLTTPMSSNSITDEFGALRNGKLLDSATLLSSQQKPNVHLDVGPNLGQSGQSQAIHNLLGPSGNLLEKGLSAVRGLNNGLNQVVPTYINPISSGSQASQKTPSIDRLGSALTSNLIGSSQTMANDLLNSEAQPLYQSANNLLNSGQSLDHIPQYLRQPSNLLDRAGSFLDRTSGLFTDGIIGSRGPQPPQTTFPNNPLGSLLGSGQTQQQSRVGSGLHEPSQYQNRENARFGSAFNSQPLSHSHQALASDSELNANHDSQAGNFGQYNPNFQRYLGIGPNLIGGKLPENYLNRIPAINSNHQVPLLNREQPYGYNIHDNSRPGFQPSYNGFGANRFNGERSSSDSVNHQQSQPSYWSNQMLSQPNERYKSSFLNAANRDTSQQANLASIEHGELEASSSPWKQLMSNKAARTLTDQLHRITEGGRSQLDTFRDTIHDLNTFQRNRSTGELTDRALSSNNQARASINQLNSAHLQSSQRTASNSDLSSTLFNPSSLASAQRQNILTSGGQSNGYSNGQFNGQSNGQFNGQFNGQSNGQSNGQFSGQSNGQLNGQSNGQFNGQSNGQSKGQSSSGYNAVLSDALQRGFPSNVNQLVSYGKSVADQHSDALRNTYISNRQPFSQMSANGQFGSGINTNQLDPSQQSIARNPNQLSSNSAQNSVNQLQQSQAIDQSAGSSASNGHINPTHQSFDNNYAQKLDGQTYENSNRRSSAATTNANHMTVNDQTSSMNQARSGSMFQNTDHDKLRNTNQANDGKMQILNQAQSSGNKQQFNDQQHLLSTEDQKKITQQTQTTEIDQRNRLSHNLNAGLGLQETSNQVNARDQRQQQSSNFNEMTSSLGRNTNSQLESNLQQNSLQNKRTQSIVEHQANQQSQLSKNSQHGQASGQIGSDMTPKQQSRQQQSQAVGRPVIRSDLDIDQIYLDPDFDATYKGVPIRKEVKLADKPALEVN